MWIFYTILQGFWVSRLALVWFSWGLDKCISIISSDICGRQDSLALHEESSSLNFCAIFKSVLLHLLFFCGFLITNVHYTVVFACVQSVTQKMTFSTEVNTVSIPEKTNA